MTANGSCAAGAEEALAEVLDASGVRSCAILDRNGELLAASVPNDWVVQAERLWSAAADPSRPAPVHVQVAIEGGEIFAVRDAGASVIAIADRFTLASLLLCDLRAALRRLPAPA